MKTTELFAEQIIIGFLVLLAGSLLFIQVNLHELKWEDCILLIVPAYLIGVMYDRFADTLLQDFDQLLRLSLGHKNWVENQDRDCFLENIYLVKAIEKGSSVADYAFYLRSRIRLARSAATLAPALTLAYLLSTSNKSAFNHYLSISIPIIYGVLFLLKLTVPNKFTPPKTKNESKERLKKHFTTHEKSSPSEKYTESENTKVPKEYKLFILSDLIKDPTFWAWILLFGIGLDVIWIHASFEKTMILLGGFSTTLLSFWTWLRISKTFKSFVYDFYVHRDNENS